MTDLVQMLRTQITAYSRPDLKSELARRIHRVNSQQADRPQNKRQHCGFKLVARSQPDACYVAAVVDRTSQPGQMIAAEVLGGLRSGEEERRASGSPQAEDR